MNRSRTKPSSEIAAPSPAMCRRGIPDLEPFNGCREMFPVRELLDARTPHGPSQVILTARVAKDSVWTSTIKIPLLGERPQSEQ